MSEFFNFAKRVFCAALVLNFAAGIFSESEDEFKKKVLSNANLAGQSAAEIMAEDDEHDSALVQSQVKRLPSTYPREVPYTMETATFIQSFYNHKILSETERTSLYNNSKKAAERMKDEYSRLVELARAEYFFGSSYMENFDLSSLESMDLTDNSGASTNNAKAGAIFDKAIEYANAALKIKDGTDAYTILAHAISANCTAKNVAYILSNGLKVRTYAKKAIKSDYSNGLAHFLSIAQDVYAPWPFCKLRSARNKLLTILDDQYIRVEKHDRFLIYSAIAYSFMEQKKWGQAMEWFNKCLKIYPENVSTKILQAKVTEKQRK